MPRIDSHVTTHISFIIEFFTTLNICYVTSLGVEQWSKIGAKELEQKKVIHFPSFFFFGDGGMRAKASFGENPAALNASTTASHSMA